MRFFFLFILFAIGYQQISAQELYPPKLSTANWHQEERVLRYQPKGDSFVIVNGKKRFNRALYGTNTAFRVEAGDLPEFALYMPGFGSNFRFGLIVGKTSKWLINASYCKAIYKGGAMRYEIKDPLLGAGYLYLDLLALAEGEGLILKITAVAVPQTAKLFFAFGGASGKNFSRNGDMGPDPEQVFYLQPENCAGNNFTLEKNQFQLLYDKSKTLAGIFPVNELFIGDASKPESPLAMAKYPSKLFPVLTGVINLNHQNAQYCLIKNPDNNMPSSTKFLADIYQMANRKRMALAERIKINTPDAFINTLGTAIAFAADAIWESPSYLHGAIGWRMRLNGWRGAYAGDVLAWHDRAKTHFSAYAQSQVIHPQMGPVIADTAFNLARSKEAMGTAMFTSGYISRDPEGKNIRPHHYDMNLVFIDQLLNHFNWTGDLAFAKKMLPLIKRHLDWEKRTFDADNDGLYDAYAAIWASDALQYSGGGVAHSSAYNFRANKYAAQLAKIFGEDDKPYLEEAKKIQDAVVNQLWITSKGTLAEYKDALGLKQKHPSPGLWTIYHSIDAHVLDAFKNYQSLRYVDTEIPHIPIRAKGLKNEDFFTLSSSNWMPYEWSLNNVVMAENMHTALANWQAGRIEEAYKLFKSELVNDFYLGGSPGNFVQISHYDANRGEAYRDFADPVGITARAVVEGLFGILPDALNHTLLIKPGLPQNWDKADFFTPDIAFSYRRKKSTETYTLKPHFKVPMALKFRIKAKATHLKMVTLNGKPITWKNIDSAIGYPEIEIISPYATKYTLNIFWKGKSFKKPKLNTVYRYQDQIKIDFNEATILKYFDPQKILNLCRFKGGRIEAKIENQIGDKAFFVQLKQGDFNYWYPVCFKVIKDKEKVTELNLNDLHWNNQVFEPQDLTTYFNDKVTQIFKQKYLSPRPLTTTLQLPLQGIGDWAHPFTNPEINDTGLRKLASKDNTFKLPSGIIFATPHQTESKNIVFTSQWDNYPKAVNIKLKGKAKAAFFLLAGSTNPMQSRITNGSIVFNYTDGSKDSISLRNPENWWPIEKDYFTDGFAFTTGAPKPVRLHLKSGEIIGAENIEQWNGKKIAGGAATALGITLNPEKELQFLTLKTLCNDVVIGLMSLTLQR